MASKLPALCLDAKPFTYHFYTINPCWSTGFETGLQRVYTSTPAKSRTPSISRRPDCDHTHPADVAIAKHPHARLPLVSRQFWAEALPAFLKDPTLQFSCPRVLHDWIQHPSNQDAVKQVRGLELRMTSLSLAGNGTLVSWANAAHIVHIARFKNLRGVRLLLQLSRPAALKLGRNYDVMSDDAWWATKLPEVVTAFMLRKLEPGRTKAAVLMYRDLRAHLPNGPLCEPQDRKLAGVIRQAFCPR